MRTLRNYVGGSWHTPTSSFRTLFNPATEEPIGRASSDGLDFQAALDHARRRGGAALRELTFAQRGQLLKAASKELRAGRDELLELSLRNNGTTLADGAFDVDGATGTLAYYAALGGALGERRWLVEGDGVQLGRSEALWGRHVLVPRRGVAVHINAFNFPAWGLAEKLACAVLGGMPVITKPATATALVAERMVEILVEGDVVPEGVLQLVCGAPGDLLARLGPQDVLAFTGSAATAARLAEDEGLRQARLRFNVEADSLNAAVLGRDVTAGSPTFELFARDVCREITQKAGQKCTAVRRILVPGSLEDDAVDALVAALRAVVAGNPGDESVTMGPLVSSDQLRDVEEGQRELASATRRVAGALGRVDGVGAPAGKGFFVAPVLLVAADARTAPAVHRREVFGPLATVLPYDGTPSEAGEVVALAGGTLVTSVYSDDREWLDAFLEGTAATCGRVYLGSRESAPVAPGSGAALPQLLHGGPGRAGGGEELGGLVGVKLYMQRLALEGERTLVEHLAAR